MADIRLKVTPKPGAYSGTQEIVERILYGAMSVLVDEGYTSFTMRRIADACGVGVGNMTYHFSSKAELVAELLDALLEGYKEYYDSIEYEDAADDDAGLTRSITRTIADLQSRQTTNLFIELWAMANHDAEIAQKFYAFTSTLRARLADRICRMNPGLSRNEADVIALFVSASIEGLTVFAGASKPHAADLPALGALAVRTFVQLAREATSKDLVALDLSGESSGLGD